jgi:hypothetical protein
MRSLRTAPRGRAATALGFAAAALVAAAACSDASAPSGSGNDFTNDTRDADRPPSAPGDGASPTGEPDAYATGQPEAGYYGDGSYVAPTYDGAAYPGVSECSSCSCPAATSYCFGGATPRKDPMTLRPQSAADAGAGDASAACPMVAAGALGCTALPAGTTDCASLIASMQTTYSCYLVCATDGTTMNVYCPNP